ncbi:MAG: BrnT family toxin [Pseudomonadota bacterium]
MDASSVYEWNEEKRRSTKEKHGIDFAEAIELFDLPHIVARSDRGDEVRYVAVGRLNNRFVAVVYTVRGEATRIITARRARDGEIRAYHQSYPAGGPLS